MLTKEREIELGYIMKDFTENKKNEKEAREAHKEIFDNYTDMAYSIANKTMLQSNAIHYSLEDAEQDALLSLASSIWDYNPEMNTKVSTLVYRRIMKAVSTGINNAYTVKVGNSGKGKWYYYDKYGEEWDNLENKPENMTKEEYVFEKSKSSGYQYNQLNNALKGTHSLNAPINGEIDLKLGDVIEDSKSTIEFDEFRIKELIEKFELSELERLVVLSDLNVLEVEYDSIRDLEQKEYNKILRKAYRKMKNQLKNDKNLEGLII